MRLRCDSICCACGEADSSLAHNGILRLLLPAISRAAQDRRLGREGLGRGSCEGKGLRAGALKEGARGFELEVVQSCAVALAILWIIKSKILNHATLYAVYFVVILTIIPETQRPG